MTMMTLEQRERLLELIKQHFIGNTSYFITIAIWEDFSKILNSLGPEKTANQWKKMWKDLIIAVQEKFSLTKAFRNMNSTAMLPEYLVLTDEELWVISTYGATGSDDNMHDDITEIDMVRQLDCRAESPFFSSDTSDDEVSPNELEHVQPPAPIDASLGLQREILKLQKKQNSTVQKVLKQQKQTNGYLHQLMENISRNSTILQQQLEEQKQINGRLVELLPLLQTKLQTRTE